MASITIQLSSYQEKVLAAYQAKFNLPSLAAAYQEGVNNSDDLFRTYTNLGDSLGVKYDFEDDED